VKALARCVGEEDVPWVLDAYFARPGIRSKHELLWLVIALRPERARGRVLLESRSPDRDNRQAAMKAIGNMGFPDRTKLLRRFLDDPDPQIRQGAHNILSELEAAAVSAAGSSDGRQ
jgi:HEAT repeat protein